MFVPIFKNSLNFPDPPLEVLYYKKLISNAQIKPEIQKQLLLINQASLVSFL